MYSKDLHPDIRKIVDMLNVSADKTPVFLRGVLLPDYIFDVLMEHLTTKWSWRLNMYEDYIADTDKRIREGDRYMGLMLKSLLDFPKGGSQGDLALAMIKAQADSIEEPTE